MGLRTTFARRTPYLVWLALSSLVLLVCERYDPYAFAAAAFLGAGVSALLFLASLFAGPRSVVLAVAAALPTVAAFWLLSTFKWA